MGEAKRRGPYELRVQQGKVKQVMRVAARELVQPNGAGKRLTLDQKRDAIRARTEQLLAAGCESGGAGWTAEGRRVALREVWLRQQDFAPVL